MRAVEWAHSGGRLEKSGRGAHPHCVPWNSGLLFRTHTPDREWSSGQTGPGKEAGRRMIARPLFPELLLSNAKINQCRVLRDVIPPTPPGPEGSNGNGLVRAQ
jgi:hypothetical protein